MTNIEQLLAGLAQHVVRLGEAVAAPLQQVRIQAGDVVVEVVWSPTTPNPATPNPAAASPTSPNGHAAPPGSQPAEHPSADAAGAALPDGAFTVCAPTVGVFYCAPAPGAPPFVTVGDTVSEGQQLAILEAMKLSNPIDADRPGRVVRVLVENATPVEYGQPLFVLEPC